jgi:hypothetical protein
VVTKKDNIYIIGLFVFSIKMGAVEIIAGVFAALAVIKLVVVMINRKAWVKHVSKKVYSGSAWSGAIFGILAILVFYYLIQSLTIIEIFSVMAFTALLMGASMTYYSQELSGFIDKVAEKPFNLSMWIYILIWLALSVWVLIDIF